MDRQNLHLPGMDCWVNWRHGDPSRETNLFRSCVRHSRPPGSARVEIGSDRMQHHVPRQRYQTESINQSFNQFLLCVLCVLCVCVSVCVCMWLFVSSFHTRPCSPSSTIDTCLITTTTKPQPPNPPPKKIHTTNKSHPGATRDANARHTHHRAPLNDTHSHYPCPPHPR
jgi:hypothetical protein